MAVSPLSRYPLSSHAAVIAPRLDKIGGPPESSYRTQTTPTLENPIRENRKRVRRDSSGTFLLATPHPPAAQSYRNASIMSSTSRILEDYSPAPFVNTTYTLAGGAEAAKVGNGSIYPDSHDDKDIGFRRGQWGTSIGPGEDGMQLDAQSLVQRESGKKRQYDSFADGSSPSHWGRAVINLVGGVANKMWEFCRSGTFKGFYAGGGQGYDLTHPANTYGVDSLWDDTDNHRVPRFANLGSVSIPGQFPDESFGHTSNQDTPSRPAKRQLTGIESDWVFVSRDGTNLNTGRKQSLSGQHSRRLSQIPQPVQSKPSPVPSRQTKIPISRRTSTVSYSGSPAVNAFQRKPNSSPRARQYSRESYTFPALSPSRTGTPLPTEVHSYMARVSREEKEADESLRKMSAKLNMMIKQGEEALRTKIIIKDGDIGLEDEGYSEDCFGAGSKRW